MNSTPITDAERKILEHAISAETSRCFEAIRAVASAPVETALREHIKALEELSDKISNMECCDRSDPPKIIIEALSGLVQAVWCRDPAAEVTLFDYDNDEDGGMEQLVIDMLNDEGPFYQVF